MILALVVVLVVLAVLVVVWIVQTRPRTPAGPILPDEPCDTCGRWISGPRCRIVQEGTDSEDGISGGWAMVAYFHPRDECCPIQREGDPDHEHAR